MPSTEAPIVLRAANQPGDLGWVVMAHGEVYGEEYGWNQDFEALVARIIAGFAEDHDPSREAGWIAEVDGQRAGCIFCVVGDEPDTAKLRVLLVTPNGRGSRLGSRLVSHCLQFARDAGYVRVTLWTDSALVAARKIYESFGFALIDTEPHNRFGSESLGENWSLNLRPQ